MCFLANRSTMERLVANETSEMTRASGRTSSVIEKSGTDGAGNLK